MNEEILNVEEDANVLAHLLNLIRMDNELITLHRSRGDAESYVSQYEELRNRNMEKLAEILSKAGLIVQLSPKEAA